MLYKSSGNYGVKAPHMTPDRTGNAGVDNTVRRILQKHRRGTRSGKNLSDSAGRKDNILLSQPAAEVGYSPKCLRWHPIGHIAEELLCLTFHCRDNSRHSVSP